MQKDDAHPSRIRLCYNRNTMSKVDKILNKMNIDPLDYPIEIRPIPPKEEGGYLLTFPDLPGCIADGETPEEAIRSGMDAAESWLKTTQEFGDHIPSPTKADVGALVSKTPKNLYIQLADRAMQKGLSVNELAVEYLTQGLKQRTTE